MMKKLRSHLSLKLLILLFLIGVIPYLLILTYTKTVGEEQILQSNIEREQAQMQQILSAINTHITQLQHSLLFLSRMETMDDIIVDDLDHRILGMLEAYQEVLGIEIDLLVINQQGRIIASTNAKEIDTPYPSLLPKADHKFTLNTTPQKQLHLDVPIYTHSSEPTLLGYLVMLYPLHNFQQFNLNTSSVHTALINQKFQYVVGQYDAKKALPLQKSGRLEDQDTLTLYEQIPSLNGWSLVYQLDKAEAFAFLHQLNRYLIIAGLIGMLIIALLARYIAKGVVRPIQHLQRHAQTMLQQRQYGLKVTVTSDDEVGQLADAFNALSSDIASVMVQLQEESALRLLRLTQLIELFHKLLESQNEKESLEIALNTLCTIMPEHPVRFEVLDEPLDYPAIYLYDFELQRDYYFGSLLVDRSLLQQDEAAFFSAISAMIAARMNQLRAFKRLKKEDEAKRTFISYLSHELRTPLHAILTQTQYLIGYEALNDNQLDKVAHIEHASQQLLQTINDLLDLARLDAGKYDLSLEEVETSTIVTTVSDVMEMLRPLAEQKGLEYTLDAQESALLCSVDVRLLRQIISNLLSNALKFTQEGMINVSITPHNSQLKISIKDSGCGIDPAIISTLFDPFVQYRNNTSTLKSSGVGLALSQRFATLMDAELSINSEGQRKGTEVILVIKTI